MLKPCHRLKSASDSDLKYRPPEDDHSYALLTRANNIKNGSISHNISTINKNLLSVEDEFLRYRGDPNSRRDAVCCAFEKSPQPCVGDELAQVTEVNRAQSNIIVNVIPPPPPQPTTAAVNSSTPDNNSHAYFNCNFKYNLH